MSNLTCIAYGFILGIVLIISYLLLSEIQELYYIVRTDLY